MALLISNLILWVTMLAVIAIGIALARQVGVLFERVAPLGALVTDSGPKVGDAAPAFELQSLDQAAVSLPGSGAGSTLLFFLSPSCPVCKKLLPVIKSMRKAEQNWLRIVLASDGDVFEHMKFWREAELAEFPYVLSTELGMAYRVSRLPYAVLIDEAGVVRSKGMINSREQLESLFTAKELGVASVQEYLAHPHTHMHTH